MIDKLIDTYKELGFIGSLMVGGIIIFSICWYTSELVSTTTKRESRKIINPRRVIIVPITSKDDSVKVIDARESRKIIKPKRVITVKPLQSGKIGLDSEL